jgi:hypothetical protein
MEGRRRGVVHAVALLAVGVLFAGALGCGEDSGGDAADGDAAAVRTSDPARTFAPMLEVAADEPWRPMSARWFIERAVFWFAEDDGCADRKIAVGHTLPEQHSARIDWIYPKGLGGWSWPAYYRNPYDADCELDFDDEFYANQLTRPHDPGDRADGIRPGEGYYLDLVDAARGGPAIDGSAVRELVYAERTDEGDSNVRLTYWTLYGMAGEPSDPRGHEGDWQRIDVVLRDLGDDRYQPVMVQSVEPLDQPDGDPATGSIAYSDHPWSALRRIESTHPVLAVTRATHALTAPGPDERCTDCLRWETWSTLVAARKELWYGFGGAWGEPGASSVTTGPLGPHRFFPVNSDAARAVGARAYEATLDD